jgi:hypothetical protein
MLDARFRPLPKWTRKPGLQMERPRFRTRYVEVLNALEHELGKLNARDILIEAGFPLNTIRNDGWPRGGSQPHHPGVVLYFTTRDGAMEFPCGTYQNFEANLYAIALTLENLRAIDRYGVTLGHEQYRGFLAIEAAPDQMTVEKAANFVSFFSKVPSDEIIGDPGAYRAAYRVSASQLHPDVAANPDGFIKLGQAKEVLDKHHKLGTANGSDAADGTHAGGTNKL